MSSLFLLLLSLASLSFLVHSSSTGGSSSSPTGTVTVLSTFSFSAAGDTLSCLSFDSSTTRGYTASGGGDIFNFSTSSSPTTVSPSYSAGAGAYFIACAVDPTGAHLYLLDTRGLQLLRFDTASPSTAPVVIAQWTAPEANGSPTALAVDFTNQIAWIGTRYTTNIYPVNLTMTGQSLGSSTASRVSVSADVTAMTLSSDGRTLYYASPPPSFSASGTVKSFTISSPTTLLNPSTPTLLYSSPTLIYPDSMLISGSTVYLKDGGAFRGDPGLGQPQDVYTFTLGSSATNTTLTALFNSTTVALPPGLVLSADGSQLYFATTTTVNSLQLAQPRPAGSSSAPVAVSSSARARSSSASVSSSPSASTSAMGVSSSAAAASSSPAAASSSPRASLASSSSASALSSSSAGAAGATSTPSGGVSSTAYSAPPSSSSSSGLSTGAIVGIVVGGAVGAVLAFIVLWLCCRRFSEGGVKFEYQKEKESAWGGQSTEMQRV